MMPRGRGGLMEPQRNWKSLNVMEYDCKVNLHFFSVVERRNLSPILWHLLLLVLHNPLTSIKSFLFTVENHVFAIVRLRTEKPRMVTDLSKAIEKLVSIYQFQMPLSFPIFRAPTNLEALIEQLLSSL